MASSWIQLTYSATKRKSLILKNNSFFLCATCVGPTCCWFTRGWSQLSWLMKQAHRVQGVVRAGQDPLWAGGIWGVPGRSCRVLTKMETVARTKRRVISSTLYSHWCCREIHKVALAKGEACGQQLLGCKLRVTGSHTSGCYPFSSWIPVLIIYFVVFHG